MSNDELSVKESGSIAAQIREALARRRMSRQELAHQAGLSLSTLEKALSGARPFTLATLVRLEDVLQTNLRQEASVLAPAVHAPPELGAYTREAVDWMIGSYLTLRPSFERSAVVYAYITEIAWDEASTCLGFREIGRQDVSFAQKGRVSLPHQSGQVYLVTNDHGQFRVMTLSRPTIAGDMYGLLSTLQVARGGRLVPVATPVVLVRTDKAAEAQLGQIDSSHPCFADYQRRIQLVLHEEFARLVGPSEATL